LWIGTKIFTMSAKNKIAIIGLGYVGLPLAHAFCFRHPVVGYDINKDRVIELNTSIDRTLELSSAQLEDCKRNKAQFTNKPENLKSCNIFIITVPTPVDNTKKPDLNPLFSATRLVGNYLNKGNIVIYESTVYPGATEEECVPILERESGLKFNKDFFCGYSPERINPGDKEHTLTKIKKVTSGSTPDVAKFVDDLYSEIIEAGTFLASSIKVAEAAKVIENAQRDINIAFVNELSIIFNKLKIVTKSVLDAASTKWNFLPFQPGLVGGHCIGVDPYYLTYKAQQLGYSAEVILGGRRINDGMGIYIANRVIKLLRKNKKSFSESRILILGITFKENCPDIRNTKVIDIYTELADLGCKVDVADYFADELEVRKEFGIDLIKNPEFSNYALVILAVAHSEYLSINSEGKFLVFDVKSVLSESDERL